MIDTARIETLISPSLEAMGYRLVRVAATGGRHAQVLQVMAERIDERPMGVDDCTELTHTVSALLDVADPIEHAYVLEVSSPGIDRPLVRREDFERFQGYEAKLELAAPIEGRRRFRGKLLGVEADRVRLNLGAEVVELPLARIQRAKLVLTDELLAAQQRRA
ncbi:MAG TPA: ribosome maturation factor RimP [Stellaceae bacterium]|nr:ribosome maturation factor RimP [Stellaceae bacterium]